MSDLIALNESHIISYANGNPLPHALTYEQIIRALDAQFVDKFAFVGIIVTIYVLWNYFGFRDATKIYERLKIPLSYRNIMTDVLDTLALFAGIMCLYFYVIWRIQ